MRGSPSSWRNRPVLVTGCTGFLGSAVTRELLDRGAFVVGLVRDRAVGVAFSSERDAKRFHATHGRVEDSIRLHSAMAVHEVGAIFHFANSDPFGNDRGTAAVLRAAALHNPGVPVITARPAGQLGLVPGDDSPAIPLGVARFGELFGGGDRKVFRVVPRTVIGLITGDAGSPESGPARDFVFVRDAARACLALAEVVGADARSRDLTFRSGWELPEREMGRLVANVFAGRTSELLAGQPPVNPLGWQPGTSLVAAIGETIEWYRAFLRTRFFGTRPADVRQAA